MTVKVNEALCEMKEKLEKTERRVREVMKEKEQLEKIIEAKLRMIKVILISSNTRIEACRLKHQPFSLGLDHNWHKTRVCRQGYYD